MRYLLIALFSLSAFAVKAQCVYTEALAGGKELMYALKDHKGKVKGYQAHQLDEMKGDTLILKSTIFTRKKKKDFDFKYEAFCQGDVLHTDGVMVVNGEFLKDYAGLKIMSKEGKLKVPASIGPETELDDAWFTVITASRGLVSVSAGGFKVEISEREYAGTETITTPAGTFDCVKIRHRSKFNMILSITVDNEVYYAPGIGTVKVMTYRNDNLINSMELEEIK